MLYKIYALHVLHLLLQNTSHCSFMFNKDYALTLNVDCFVYILYTISIELNDCIRSTHVTMHEVLPTRHQHV